MEISVDTTLEEAIGQGCDTVQVKYDGLWSQVAAANGQAVIINRLFSGKDQKVIAKEIDPTINCTLIGSQTPSGTIYIFDCWLVEDLEGGVTDLRREKYRSRFVAARIQVSLIGGGLRIVYNHPIASARELWKTLPSTPDAKGLVFRSSNETAFQRTRVARYYPERPTDL